MKYFLNLTIKVETQAKMLCQYTSMGKLRTCYKLKNYKNTKAVNKEVIGNKTQHGVIFISFNSRLSHQPYGVINHGNNIETS